MRSILHGRIAKQIRLVHCQVSICVRTHMLVTVTDQWGVSTTQSASNKKIVIKARVVDGLCRASIAHARMHWYFHDTP